jgi:phage-related protein
LLFASGRSHNCHIGPRRLLLSRNYDDFEKSARSHHAGALRIRDEQHNWRIMYRVDPTMVLVVGVYDKKTQKIPDEVIDRCKKRLKTFDDI